MLVEIKEIAINLFSKKGYEGTSIRDIAKSLGITPAALYFHFSSKEELFLEVLREGWKEISEEAEEIIINNQGKSYEDILHEVYRYYVISYVKDSQKSVFLLRSVMFSPEELKEKVFNIFVENSSEINKHIKKIFKKCIEEDIIKNLDIQTHEDLFYKFVDCFLFEITTTNKTITIDEIEKHWIFYWTLIKK